MINNTENFRVDAYVFLRILKKLWDNNKEYKRTELQYAVRMNYRTLQRYISYMLKNKLIIIRDEIEGHPTIKITQMGIDAYLDISKWLMTDGNTQAYILKSEFTNVGEELHSEKD